MYRQEKHVTCCKENILKINSQLLSTVLIPLISIKKNGTPHFETNSTKLNTRVGTLIVATIYLQLIQNRYMFRSFIVLQRSHQHCVQPVASDVEVVGYL